ncbi:hypothetical protein NA23_07770 [Fervidobacterium islandicum]|uniref:Uncharacterized protein n=1 Tax=Fervidobacterium islandicum TaxID=2423 RepID=A0AAI8CLI3_FERIS|nr:hypothetical protein [Fervidobacterium islandicum]AMW33149.1 hypothetical protein NA23_07770 [Fervidobacterium islandicum]
MVGKVAKISVLLIFLFVVVSLLAQSVEPLPLYIQEYYKAYGRFPKPPDWVKVGTVFVYQEQVGTGTKGVDAYSTQGYNVKIVVGIDKNSGFVVGLQWRITFDLRGNIDFSSQIAQIQFAELESLAEFLSQIARVSPVGVEVQGGYLPDGGFYFAYASGDYYGFTRYNYTLSKEGVLVSSGFLENTSGTSSSVGQLDLIKITNVQFPISRLPQEILRNNYTYQGAIIEGMTGMIMTYFQVNINFDKQVSDGIYSFDSDAITNYTSSRSKVLGTDLIGPNYINPQLLKGEILSIPEIGLRWMVEGQGQMGGIQTGVYIQGVKIASYEYAQNGLLLQYIFRTSMGYQQGRIAR